MLHAKVASWVPYSRKQNEHRLMILVSLASIRTLQFLVSPYIGSLSDKYGRKKVLLITMIGNILSALVYVNHTFASVFVPKLIPPVKLDKEHDVRVVHAFARHRRAERGQCPVGNVRRRPSRSAGNGVLTRGGDEKSAILSDITTPANRAKALAHVGIAFAICFCIGPPIGAYFASQPVALRQTVFGTTELNVYAAPAILTLVLLVVETAFLAVALPETRGKLLGVQSSDKSGDGLSSADLGRNAKGRGDAQVKKDRETPAAQVRPAEQRIKIFKSLRVLHFLFLGVFSGVEFTLTFLTFDRT
jgi:MFS family permease